MLKNQWFFSKKMEKLFSMLRRGLEIGKYAGGYCWFEVNSATGKRRPLMRSTINEHKQVPAEEGLYAEDACTGKMRLTAEALDQIEMDNRRRSGRLPPYSN